MRETLSARRHLGPARLTYPINGRRIALAVTVIGIAPTPDLVSTRGAGSLALRSGPVALAQDKGDKKPAAGKMAGTSKKKGGKKTGGKKTGGKKTGGKKTGGKKGANGAGGAKK